MRRFEQIPEASAPTSLLFLGGLYVVVAVVVSVLEMLEGISPSGAIIEALLLGVPGAMILAWGYWLPRSDLLPEMYVRILAWCLGGLGAMLAVTGLVQFMPGGGLDRPIFSTALATALGSVAGLGVGTYESRAVSRALEAERQRDEVRRERERLAALNHVNAVVRDINEEMTEQPTREAIEELVCERLAASASYEFAWVGVVDEAEVVPSTTAAVGDYLDDLTITADDSETGQGPTGRALRTGETQVVQDVQEASEYDPWRDSASERGIRSSAAVPIAHDDDSYGVLNVYATRADAFDGEEQAVISQLGEIMGLAMMAIERDRELRERERRYRTLAENVPNGSVVLFDTDLEYQAAAGTIYDDLSIDPSTLQGTRVGEVDGLPETVAQQLQEAYRAALDGEERNVQLTFEGRVFDVQVIPIRDDDGEITGGMTLSQDVTERRALRRTYRDIFDNVADGLVVHDHESSEIVDVNEQFCEMNGYERSALVGETIGKVTPPDSEYTEERARELVKQTEEEGPQLFEWRNQRGDGTTYPVEVHLSAVRIEGNDRILGSVRDITDRKERERQLEYERERLEFLNRLVRHNLLNDLNNVQARVDLLGRYLDPAGQEHLETVQSRTENMVDLITTLRSLMQIIGRGEQPELESVDLGSVLGDEVEHARSAFEDAEFEVETDLDAVGEVVADDLLGEVFENLLVNAVEHNDKDVPRVTVDVDADDEWTTVTVADNGPGVPESQKARIFEKGEKDFQSTGTGFGLYLVREIVEGCGGTISVSDDEPTPEDEATPDGEAIPDAESTGAVFHVELQSAE